MQDSLSCPEAWKVEIEQREAKSNMLVLRFGAYLWNIRWSLTNDRGLMKYENLFQVKNLTTEAFARCYRKPKIWPS